MRVGTRRRTLTTISSVSFYFVLGPGLAGMQWDLREWVGGRPACFLSCILAFVWHTQQHTDTHTHTDEGQHTTHLTFSFISFLFFFLSSSLLPASDLHSEGGEPVQHPSQARPAVSFVSDQTHVPLDTRALKGSGPRAQTGRNLSPTPPIEGKWCCVVVVVFCGGCVRVAFASLHLVVFCVFVDTNTKTLIPHSETSCETGDDGFLCAGYLDWGRTAPGDGCLAELRLLVSVASASKSN